MLERSKSALLYVTVRTHIHFPVSESVILLVTCIVNEHSSRVASWDFERPHDDGSELIAKLKLGSASYPILRHLHIHGVSLGGPFELSNLVRLHAESFDAGELMGISLPKLEILEIRKMYYASSTIENRSIRLDTLRELRLHYPEASLLPFSMPNLETLHVELLDFQSAASILQDIFTPIDPVINPTTLSLSFGADPRFPQLILSSLRRATRVRSFKVLCKGLASVPPSLDTSTLFPFCMWEALRPVNGQAVMWPALTKVEVVSSTLMRLALDHMVSMQNERNSSTLCLRLDAKDPYGDNWAHPYNPETENRLVAAGWGLGAICE
jgi:hypothetical protein